MPAGRRFLLSTGLKSKAENTTIVLLGDHITMAADFFDGNRDVHDRRIYNCFINLPEELEPEQKNNREFSTMDMFPTILASMGAKIEGNRLGLGVNLFSGEDTLPEQMGRDEFNRELKFFSRYYEEHLLLDRNR